MNKQHSISLAAYPSSSSAAPHPQGPAACTPAAKADGDTVPIALLLNTSSSMHRHREGSQIELTRKQRLELQAELAKLATEREALVQKLLKEQGKQSQGELETPLLPSLHSQAAGHGVEWLKTVAKP